MAHIISMANHKGGVGKTSSVQNIGAGLARAGQRVLLIDFDPQANLSDGFGYRDLEFGIFEAMLGEIDVPVVELDLPAKWRDRIYWVEGETVPPWYKVFTPRVQTIERRRLELPGGALTTLGG